MQPTGVTLFLTILTGSILVGLFLFRLQMRKRAIRSLRANPNDKSTRAVRQGDMGDPRKHQLRLIEKAKKLLAEGKHNLAAEEFRSAGQYREAVSTYENAGEIGKACAILFELERPNRAGAMFERHKLFEEASDAYLKAGLKGDAARCLEQAARKTPELYGATAQLYKSLGKTGKALEIYAQAGLVEEFVRYAYREAAWTHLRDFLSREETLRTAFDHLDFGMVRAFVRELPLNRRTAEDLAFWTTTLKKLELVEISVKTLSRDDGLLNHYWSAIPERHVRSIAEKMAGAARREGKHGLNFIHLNATAMYESRCYEGAQILYSAAERYLMAAKCHSHLGQLDGALACLKKTADARLIHSLEKIISSYSQVSIMSEGTRVWSKEARTAALQLFENTTPQKDEVERTSPFTLAG